jgi:glycerophosphoryl diester phosphodiesterase
MTFSDLLKQERLIAAHRGYRSIRPENSRSALLAAAGRCDFIELDVTLTKDKVPVILHDDTLGRTTDVASFARFRKRRPWHVGTFTLTELQMLDFGSWFYRDDPFGSIAAGEVCVFPGQQREGVLTLAHALRLAKQHHLFLNIELKRATAPNDEATCVTEVLRVIEATGMAERLLLSSFEHGCLLRCKAAAPGIPTALLQETPPRGDIADTLARLGAGAYHPSDSIVDAETVAGLRQKGYAVNVYTVNDLQRAETLFGWGVNGIFTDLLLRPLAKNNKG